MQETLLKLIKLPLVLSVIAVLSSCNPKDSKWKGQGPLEVVNTQTRPVEFQLKSTFNVGNSIFCSNEFDGAQPYPADRGDGTVLFAIVTGRLR